MKKVIVLLFVLFACATVAHAQENITDLTLKKIHTYGPRVPWVQGFFTLYAHIAPDSVSKTDTTVTMFFTKINMQTTVSHLFYVHYIETAEKIIEEKIFEYKNQSSQMQGEQSASPWESGPSGSK